MDTLSIFGHKIGHNPICLYKNNSRNPILNKVGFRLRNPILNKVGFRLIFIDSKGNSLY